MNWIHKTKFAEDRGITMDTIRGWCQQRWERGIHYAIIGKNTLINPEAVDRWIAEENGQAVSDQEVMDCKSESNSTGTRTRNKLNATQIQKVTSRQRFRNETGSNHH